MITLFHAPQSRSGRLVWLMEEIGQPLHAARTAPSSAADGSGGRDPGKQSASGRQGAGPVPRRRSGSVDLPAIALYLTELFP